MRYIEAPLSIKSCFDTAPDCVWMWLVSHLILPRSYYKSFAISLVGFWRSKLGENGPDEYISILSRSSSVSRHWTCRIDVPSSRMPGDSTIASPSRLRSGSLVFPRLTNHLVKILEPFATGLPCCDCGAASSVGTTKARLDSYGSSSMSLYGEVGLKS